jgi:hypothetical protein
VYPRSDPEFDIRFEQHTGARPKVLAASGYDAVHFLVAAIKQGVKLTDPEARFAYRGVSGEYALPPVGRGIARNAAKIVAMREGKVVEVSTTP